MNLFLPHRTIWQEGHRTLDIDIYTSDDSRGGLILPGETVAGIYVQDKNTQQVSEVEGLIVQSVSDSEVSHETCMQMLAEAHLDPIKYETTLESIGEYLDELIGGFCTSDTEATIGAQVYVEDPTTELSIALRDYFESHLNTPEDDTGLSTGFYL